MVKFSDPEIFVKGTLSIKSAKLNLTLGKYPKENIQDSEHGENLKSRILQ
jgi:hypothetical protein